MQELILALMSVVRKRREYLAGDVNVMVNWCVVHYLQHVRQKKCQLLHTAPLNQRTPASETNRVPPG